MVCLLAIAPSLVDGRVPVSDVVTASLLTYLDARGGRFVVEAGFSLADIFRCSSH
jgi:hypothetical protein